MSSRALCISLGLAAACGGDASNPVDGGADAPPVDLTCLDGAALSPTERMLVELPADSWTTLPGTALDPWCRSRGLPENGEPTAYRCGNVIRAWGGGAFDAGARAMILFGGGHNDYAGNEVYAFDLATAAWRVVRPPTPMAQVVPSRDTYADGTPVSRHTYDGFAYLPDRQRLLVWGGARYQDGGSTWATWLLDTATGAWTRKADFSHPSPGGAYWMGSDYDQASGKVYARTEAGLFAYDVAGDAWARLADFGYPPYWPERATSNNRRGVVVPDRHLFFTVGGKTNRTEVTDQLVWDLAAGADASASWPPRGDTTAIERTAPGADLDTAADAIVAWSGGAPAILSLADGTWRPGSATGAPAAQVPTGTFGRFRYVAYLNVFVLVNEPEEDVAFYKHTAGCGPR